MEDKVIRFIDKFKESVDFKNKNSYWFCKILNNKFPQLELYYNKKKDYFVAYDTKSDSYYTYDGLEKIINREDLVNFELLYYEDKDLFYSILKKFRS